MHESKRSRYVQVVKLVTRGLTRGWGRCNPASLQIREFRGVVATKKYIRGDWPTLGILSKSSFRNKRFVLILHFAHFENNSVATWLKGFSTLAQYIVYNYNMVVPRKIDSVQVTSVRKARLTMGHVPEVKSTNILYNDQIKLSAKSQR